MKIQNVLATFLLTLSFGIFANANPVCHDLFHASAREAVLATEVETPPVVVNLHVRDLPAEDNIPKYAAALTDLLEMYLSTPFQGEGPKEFRDKGKLKLGQALPNHETLEFEYRVDLRSGQKVFRLAQISLISKSGYSVTLEKNPLTSDGASLRRTQLTLEDHRPIALDKTLGVPVEIQGKILKDLSKWIDRFPLLSETEARIAISGGEVSTWMAWKSGFRKNMIFMGKTMKKQTFKYVLLAAVLVGAQNLPELAKSIGHVPGLGKIERVMEGDGRAGIATAQADVIKRVLSSKAGSPDEAKKIRLEFTTELAHEKEIGWTKTLADIQSQNQSLTLKEQLAGGTAMFDTEELPELMANGQVVLGPQLQKSGKRAILIATFETQHKIMLIPIVRAEETSAPSAAAITITSEAYPKTYANLLAFVKKEASSKGTVTPIMN